MAGLSEDRGFVVFLRVGVRQGIRKAFLGEADNEPVFLAGIKADFCTLYALQSNIQLSTQKFIFPGGNSAGAAVSDEPPPEGGEISPGDHIVGADSDTHSQGLEYSASQKVLEWVVSEKRKVGRAAPGGDAH